MGFINIEEVRERHKWLMGSTKSALYDGLDRAKRLARVEIWRYPTFHPHSHKLQRSTHYAWERTANGGKFVVWNDARYALAIEDGAKPHDITPKRSPFLTFFWERYGIWVRLKKVSHPGNAPYRYLWRAYNKAGGYFGKCMLSSMSRIASKF